MIFVIIAVAEAIFKCGEEVLRIEARTQLGHELDVGCVGSAKVKETKVAICIERPNELLKSRAGP